jgi:NADH-quinone oxidoreductase subunit L
MPLASDASSGLFGLVPLIIFFPVLGLLANLVLGRRLGERFVGVVASLAVALSFGVAVAQVFALLGQPGGARVIVADWIAVGSLSVPWAIHVDTLSVTMMLMVSGVSTLIHVYAIGYMHEDVRLQGDPGRYTRFFIYFNLFVASMMVLVTGDSFLTLFVGWEGVGLCSYLLIGFWYEKGAGGIGNAIAGKKAFVANRIGDFGFLVAMFLTYRAFGSLEFEEVFQRAELAGPAAAGVLTAITLFLLMGATGKSAQIPLYVWLPDAMAGPTPVSALIHAATMVTAGIYMIARTHALFALAPASANVVALIGAATALWAASIAVGQYDIKKVLAYSTISQLGFMIAAVGLGAYVAGMFHLLTHAFFKALLFLSAGSVIHGVERGHHHVAGHAPPSIGHSEEPFDPNDMRSMGGLRNRMPKTFAVYVLGALALAGIPPLAGFFSKDEILAEAAHLNPAVYVLLISAAFLTAFYMGRQIWMVFFGEPRSEAAAHAQESPPLMTTPLIILAVLAFFGGALNLPQVNSLSGWLAHTLGEVEIGEFRWEVAVLSTGLAVLAIALAWALYGRRPLARGADDPLRRILGPVFAGMERKWGVDEAYNFLFVQRYVGLARLLGDVIEMRFWHDWFHDRVLGRAYREGTRWLSEGFDLPVIDGAANGLANLTRAAAGRLRTAQTGYVRTYALAVLIGVVFVLGFLLLR